MDQRIDGVIRIAYVYSCLPNIARTPSTQNVNQNLLYALKKKKLTEYGLKEICKY